MDVGITSIVSVSEITDGGMIYCTPSNVSTDNLVDLSGIMACGERLA